MKRLKPNATKSISGGILRALTISTVLVGISIFLIISVQQVYTYHRMYDQLLNKELESTNNFIRELVNRDLKLIERRRLELDEVQEQKTKEHVEEVARIASVIYEENKSHKSKDEIKTLILNFLVNLKSSNMVSINTLDGIGVWHPECKAFEGKNLIDITDNDGKYFMREDLNFLSKQDAGYIRYPNEELLKNNNLKYRASYVKTMPELGWFFISKCYPDQYIENFTTEIANRICHDTFAFDGYSFITEQQGKVLAALGKSYGVNDTLSFSTHPDEEINQSFVVLQQKMKDNPAGFFFKSIRYGANGNKENVQAYVAHYAPCNWFIGCAYSEQKLEDSLLIHKQELQRQIILNIIYILIISAITLLFQFNYGNRFAQFIQRDFNEFLKFFRTARINKIYIDSNLLRYEETKNMANNANDMIEELRQSMNDMLIAKRKAVKSDRLKSAFLANLSHEIRTPMNAIVGFSDLLDDDELSNEDRAELISLIKESSQELLSLIEGIIDTAKIEVGDIRLNKSNVSVPDILDNATNFTKSLIHKHGKIIAFNSTCHLNNNAKLFTDKSRLEHALHYILENAVKFTYEGAIHLTIEQSNNKVYFHISDTGMGISEENQQIIFDRFTRVEDLAEKKSNLSRTDRGIGVGLALCKNIVSALGGEIWVDSIVDVGSTFHFYINIDKDDA